MNAPFGQFAMATLRASTKALASHGPDDATYTVIEKRIQSLTTRRDALATEMKGVLDGAEFKGQAINTLKALSLILEGTVLLGEAKPLATLSLRVVVMHWSKHRQGLLSGELGSQARGAADSVPGTCPQTP